MKKSLIILSLVISGIFLSDAQELNNSFSDPFIRMADAIYYTDAMAFTTCYMEKKFLAKDTLVSYADILVKKCGITISYLQIIPEEGEAELLYCHDTAWLVDHQMEKLECIGTSIEALSHNILACYFPFTLFEIDPSISQSKPFWHVIASNNYCWAVALDIANHSRDISGIRVEYNIGNPDLMIHGALKEFTYLGTDNIYEELEFDNYIFPDPNEIKAPDYFSIYAKDLSLFQPVVNLEKQKNDSVRREIFLNNPDFYDLKGNPYQLPDEGLVFFDLWYTGCAPCLKSAPVIENLYNTFKDRVYFLSVDEIDFDTAKIAMFRDKMGISMPVLTGGKEKIAAKINGDGGYPVFFLLDAESRKVLWSMAGFAENLQDIISDAILKNL
jgi:thiol-disulfide isomerase/thioredoxin